jgi:hypothetical protein
MRFFLLLFITLSLFACCPNFSSVPTTEEGVGREAELLVRASLTDRLLQRTMTYYRDLASSMLMGEGLSQEEANAVVDSELQSILPIEEQRLVDALVPIYRRYYTPEEIHQLLSFYQTEVAHKSQQISSQIAAESQQYVRLWGENFGEKLLDKISSK